LRKQITGHLEELDSRINNSGGFDGLHTSLTAVTPDQHHAKSHTHDGTDGSGTVDYSDLTGKPTIPPAQTFLHADLTDTSNADMHPTSAITGLDAEQAQQDAAINIVSDSLLAHENDKANPHEVTYAQLPDKPTTFTDLGNAPDSDSVIVTSSTGNNTDILGATATLAGVMTASDKTKLEGLVASNIISGTWTPQWDRAGAYSNQIGGWMRVGDMVTVTGSFSWSGMNNSGVTGNAEITQLPFAPVYVGGAHYSGAGTFSGLNGLDWSVGQFLSLGCASATRTIAINASHSTSSGVTPVDQRMSWGQVSNTGYIHFSMSYIAVPI